MKKILIALLTTLIATTAVAQSHTSSASSSPAAAEQEHHEKWGKEQREKLAEKLGLTPEQREKIKALRIDHDEQEKNVLKLKLAKVDLKEMLKKDSASDEDILKQADVINKMMVDQNMQKIHHILAIRKILTPEQRAKFHEFMDAHRKGEHGGFGHPFGDRRDEFQKRFRGEGDGGGPE